MQDAALRSTTIVSGILAAALAACVGTAPDGGGGGGADARADDIDAGSGVGTDAGDGVAERCVTNVEVPVDPGARPATIMPASELATVAARMPCVTDPALRAILESERTMWYDRASIVPGYQDSFGDNVIAPIGMRPNTISSSLIDTAVPGGHAQIFAARGQFHFPFGAPIGSSDDHVRVVDFWQLPTAAGEPVPVVWWLREPNNLTHRLNWLFPVGTVFGEVLFMRAGDALWPFEIRLRVREIDAWRSDAFRPFRTAEELAVALEARRTERASWAADPDIDRLIAHLRDDSTLSPVTLGSSNFASAFPAMTGAFDLLPGLDDPSILQALLMEQPFRSATDAVWKASGSLRAYAAGTDAGFSIVPRGYNGGLFEVNTETCERCHRDAGRPFKDWYDNILAYGELWGEDETFSWHPFANDTFVNGNGDVVDFNYDNRTFRRDFVDAGLLVRYDSGAHPATLYKAIPRAWKGYAY